MGSELKDFAKPDVDWRWTGARVKVFGLDPLVILIFPIVFISGLSWKGIIIALLFLALCVWAALTTPDGRLISFFRRLYIRKIQGLKWKI